MEKKNVIVFIDWFYPAFKAGGPIRSVDNLINGLSKYFNFFVITSNRELDGEPIDVLSDQWIDKGNFQIIYLSKEKKTVKTYRALLNYIGSDVIYLNSLFSWNYTLKPYLAFKKSGKRIVIAPRGMLGKGALSIKPFKKKLFLSIAKQFFFERKNTIWQATSQNEAKDILNKIGEASKLISASNFPPPIIDRNPDHINKKSGELKMIFFSRILPIKNLHFVLEVLKSMDKNSISLDIYGPIEDKEYWEQCLPYIEAAENINYKGKIEPHQVAGTLQSYHYLIQPSDNENFGHSIVEALSCGVPILISKNTPWSDLSKYKAGYDLELESGIWKETIIGCANLSKEEYLIRSKSSIQFISDKLDLENIVQDYLKLFYF